MGSHEVEVVFTGSRFATCYFTLDEEKTVRLEERPGGTFRGRWRRVDLRDATGRESVRFSLAARGVPGGPCTLRIMVDRGRLRTYGKKEEFPPADRGWLSLSDIVYLAEH